jgi:hypothetical protein
VTNTFGTVDFTSSRALVNEKQSSDDSLVIIGIVSEKSIMINN